MNLPKEPFMLLSVVNTELRDNYDSLDEFCGANDVDRNELESTLKAAGFEYLQENNSFR